MKARAGNPLRAEPRHIGGLLGQRAEPTLRQQLDRNSQIHERVCLELPKELAAACQSCAISSGRLSVYVISSAWASQLRFYLPSLKTKLEEHLRIPLSSVVVRVSTTVGSNPARVRKPRRPGPQVAELLEDSARHEDDQELQRALLRLAKTLTQG